MFKPFFIQFSLMLLSISFANHIIFEQVGEMASSVTYIHVKMQLNFQDFTAHHKMYIQKLDKIYYAFQHTQAFDHVSTHDRYDVRKMHHEIVQTHLSTIQNLTQRRKETAKQILRGLEGLKQSLPQPMQPTPKSNRIYRREESRIDKIANTAAANVLSKAATTIVRQPRGVISLGLGILGTFMGLYNSHQIKTLQNDLEHTQDAHNRLVEVVQTNENHLQKLSSSVDDLIKVIQFTKAFDISTIASDLMDIENQLRERLNQMTHVVQKAQDHRLAIDFIPADQLQVLYERIKAQATAMSHKMITEQPSDLFQLELSYFFDGENMQMLLHVPIVPNDSLLRLFKLHPFPLPLDKNYSIIPMVQDELLAISAGFNRFSARLSGTDLLGCHAINNVYLCERHGVLQKELNDSCLGALYLQDFPAVQELCPLFIRPASEMVQQLLDNWFLVFSPKAQTAFITCKNGTQGDAYLKVGITRIHLSPGCKMNLQKHLLNADFSLNLPSDIVHFQWDWDTNVLFPDASNEIKELLELGNEAPTIRDLNDLRVTRAKREFNTLKFFVSFVCSILALALIATTILFLIIQDPIKRSKLFQYLKRKQTPPILNMDSNPQERIPLPRLRPSCELHCVTGPPTSQI